MSSESQVSAKSPRKKAKRQRRERGRLHLSPSPSGIWYMRGTVANQTINESTGTHSEDHAKAIRDKRERELLDEAVYGRKATYTFADACDSYYRLVSKTNSTCRHIPDLLKHLGKRKLSEIRPSDIQNLALELYPKHQNTTRNTHIITPARTIMLHAAEHEMCERKVIKSFPDDSKMISGPPPGWIEKFLAECQRKDCRAAVAFCTTTAARAIEMCRLEWSSVNLEEGTATIFTKQGKLRTVPLTGQVMQFMSELPRDKAKVFGFRNTTGFWEVLDAECKKLGMERMSPHRVGRHAFAERMLALGYDCYTVCKMGGWESLKVFTDRYGHLEKAKTDEAMRKAGADLFAPKLKIVGGG